MADGDRGIDAILQKNQAHGFTHDGTSTKNNNMFACNGDIIALQHDKNAMRSAGKKSWSA